MSTAKYPPVRRSLGEGVSRFSNCLFGQVFSYFKKYWFTVLGLVSDGWVVDSLCEDYALDSRLRGNDCECWTLLRGAKEPTFYR
jgi:hypothetical protein